MNNTNTLTRIDEHFTSCQSWMTSFKGDIDYDRLDQSRQFIHIIRRTGTEIYSLDPLAYPPKGQRVPYLFFLATRGQIMESMCESIGRDLGEHQIFFVDRDADRVKEVTQAEAVSIYRAMMSKE